MAGCKKIVKKYIFNGKDDLLDNLREILDDPDHPENYWIANEEDGRFSCHFCDKSYAGIGTAKTHESSKHNHKTKSSRKSKPKPKDAKDELYNYVRTLFVLTSLLKNLDTAIDMADGARSVRSAKYELPLFNKTNKLKYVIGCIHLTELSEKTLTKEQRERLITNRTINIQGGKNNNLALDEYLEMLNRDSKDIVSGHQTKESILKHSKQFPHIINSARHFDALCQIKGRKGFHKLPGYKADVVKAVKELHDIDAFKITPGRKLKCRDLCFDSDPYDSSHVGLPTMIQRHKPKTPFSRLRDRRY